MFKYILEKYINYKTLPLRNLCLKLCHVYVPEWRPQQQIEKLQRDHSIKVNSFKNDSFFHGLKILTKTEASTPEHKHDTI